MFKFEDNKCYGMPCFFGGSEYDRAAELYYHDAVGLSFAYATDGDQLANYLPEGFELIRPELNVSYSQNREVDWMAGSGYNLVQVSVPARFSGQRDRVEGEFVLVIWENKTAPILGGREQTGMPKIYAEIEDLHIYQQNYFTNASYEGNTFLRMELTGVQSVDEEKTAQTTATNMELSPFGWRYIPKVGGPGAELSQPILYPQRMEVKSVSAGCGTIQWTELKPEQNPDQWRIIRALAGLPIIQMVRATLAKGVLVLKPAQARVLE